MDLSLSLNAKEVLFHLNYMGYRNVTSSQLKSFMLDLKKLIKYESSPRTSTTEVHVQAGPSSVNIQRLFDAHTITSKTKQKEKPKETAKAQPQQHLTQHRAQPRPTTITEVPESKEEDVESAVKAKPVRAKSADALQRRPSVDKRPKPQATCVKKTQPNSKTVDKENIPVDNVPQPPAKSKMWIRPKSGSQATRKNVKRTDPVSLYQAYQKDWARFKPNICESSHSELRWSIREKMMGNQ